MTETRGEYTTRKLLWVCDQRATTGRPHLNIRQLEHDGYIVGDPQPTERYTVDQLKAMGFVGIYRYEDAPGG